MKVAVTGASGFIGKHVVEELNTRQVEVVAITRNLNKPLPDLVNGQWIEMDLSCPPSNVFKALGKPDILIHLAWDGLPNYKSLHHYETELPIQYLFLRKLIDQGLGSLTVTGTCFEYGMQSGKLSEDMLSMANNPYGFAKNALRTHLEFLKTEKPFNLTWCRLFYLFGEGQSEASLLPQLKAAVREGLEEFNMSGGEQLRDYLSVLDVARTISMIAMSGRDNGVVNICSGVPISVRSLVERWIEDNGWSIKLNLGYYPYPTYEPMAFWGSVDKMKSLI